MTKYVKIVHGQFQKKIKSEKMILIAKSSPLLIKVALRRSKTCLLHMNFNRFICLYHGQGQYFSPAKLSFEKSDFSNRIESALNSLRLLA